MSSDTKEQESLPQVQHLSVSEEAGGDSSSSVKDPSGQSTPLTEPGNQNDNTKIKTENGSSATNGPLKTPFGHPLPSCKPAPRPQLNDEQENKYSTLLSAIKEWSSVPTSSARNASTAPMSDSDRMFLTRECLLRYLRATNWNVNQAKARLQKTLTWRREFKVNELSADYISPENETGKQVILGYDNDARPCLYLDPGRQNTKKSDRQIQHLVFMLERAIEMMDSGQEMIALLINFKTTGVGGGASVGQGKQVLEILQGHYPERLGRALISELPWYITTFFKLISPFIDPVTKSKMIFNQPLRDKYVPAAQLWNNQGGDVEFEYDHSVYWPALNRMCEERRQAYRKRWEESGRQIGESEYRLRGGE